MTLFAATLAAAALLLVPGVVLLWNGPVVERTARAFPRSDLASYVFFGSAGLWFLYLVAHLGPADFGEYRQILVAVFAAVGLGAFFVARDFLAVRGVAILFLLAARPALDASMAYSPPPDSRVWLNAAVYVAIVASIYFGTMPYQARDFIGWIFFKSSRPRILGAVCAIYGAALAVLATTYSQKY